MRRSTDLLLALPLRERGGTRPGSPIEQWPEGALAEPVVVDLAQASCPEGAGTSFAVVETANPGSMKLVEVELALQASPGFDPATRVTPRFIRPTHMLKGQLAIGPDGSVATHWLEDGQGNVVASGTVAMTLARSSTSINSSGKSITENGSARLAV